ncbi:hypothetical protein IEO21_03070 [Rhodonia placenta]|uniref:Zn(2)-C6 fungal-type domain-containing protein n=2 Tax=Rhodonia placenta TaxID=104341 RepID=A0A1X6NED4_9APHY|nr:hypothetical protein POSPLADRAFT_1127019 [Postia placenta MAD-698-R-SB12]KAF9817995.1 hypothetical protein IEO21_03070 [Postia placenta]OSX66954.1 hypothetical protein POSPLADRAFT_1127019 [Postia placenta MAD-698-R-SB12]
MSALSEASTPAQDTAPPSIDTQQLQQAHLANDLHSQAQGLSSGPSAASDSGRKPKAPSVRRACTACHSGKTRCSEVLPCQSCLKRGLGDTCAYPDPDADHVQQQQQQPPLHSAQVPFVAPPMPYPPPPMHGLNHPNYYDYNNAFTGASTSTFRPSKRPRNLTEEEAAAITRNFTRGDFFVGTSAPVRIDPRLPVRLTLAEGDQVHFSIGEAIV